MSKIILGLGAGQCGLGLLADILNAQPGVKMTCEETPLLPWKQQSSELIGSEEVTIRISERFLRWKQKRSAHFVGDAATSYLSYVDDAIEAEPDLRIVCLKRPRGEIVSAFCHNLNENSPRPVDNWSKQIEPGWYRSPLRMHIYPKYDAPNRESALGMYYDEYYAKAEIFAQRFPEQFRIFDPEQWGNEHGVRELLNFVGIPFSDQNPVTGQRASSEYTYLPNQAIHERWQAELAQHPISQCVILVPFLGYIHQECDASLKELERRGYQVRRVGGYSAIDQGRNQMATDAIAEGFEETFWIDSDIAFDPDDIEKMRAHRLPIVAGLYPQKGRRALASHVVPDTPNMTFGRQGGLVEMLYEGTGFLLVRREVYLNMQEQLNLPLCNDRFGNPMIPYFQPLIRKIEDGTWYLAEDYAFCHRARACGYQIIADTSVRLWHIGYYKYSWEDAGIDRPRFDTFTLNFGPEERHGHRIEQQPGLHNLLQAYPWPETPPKCTERMEPVTEPIHPECLGLLHDSIPQESRFVVVVGDRQGKMARPVANIASHALVMVCCDWNKESDSVSIDHFYSENWSYRDKIFLIPVSLIHAVTGIVESGISPDKIVFHSEPFVSFSAWKEAIHLLTSSFPDTQVMGTGWEREDMRDELNGISVTTNRKLEFRERSWRLAAVVNDDKP